MKYTIQACICDKCKKEVQIMGGRDLPPNWSLISSSCERERDTDDGQGRNSVNYATICDSCHSAMFGDFWKMTMSSNDKNFLRRF